MDPSNVHPKRGRTFANRLLPVVLVLMLLMSGSGAQPACTVTSTSDSGVGTLRACFDQIGDGGHIDFDIPGIATAVGDDGLLLQGARAAVR